MWWNSSWAISNSKRWWCESAALNIPANLENSAVTTGLEKVSFHSNPKVRQSKEWSNYHTIALISHTSKVMLKIIQARLQEHMNYEFPGVQAGFRKGWGTRDQIVSICWIIEKARKLQKNIYFCFVGYAKAFDCVDHNQPWKILKEMGIPDHLTCLLRNLYAGQEATVRTGHGTIDWFQIRKGVCQASILSLRLFNLYAEYIMGNARLDEAQAGIKIAGRNINNLRYAVEKAMATHLVGCSPWGRYKSDTTEWLHFHFSLSCIREGNGTPLQCSCLENPRDGGAWWAAVYGVAQSQTWLKQLSSSSSKYADDTTLMEESKEELKSLLVKVKEESEKASLKFNIQKTKIMASGPPTSWQIDGETMETVTDFIFSGSKITADGDYSHEI